MGPETSAALAGEFMSIDALKAASPADPEQVYGVGSNTAHAIHRRFNHDPPHGNSAETIDGDTDSDLETEQ